jgi:hypothetical protein
MNSVAPNFFNYYLIAKLVHTESYGHNNIILQPFIYSIAHFTKIAAQKLNGELKKLYFSQSFSSILKSYIWFQ